MRFALAAAFAGLSLVGMPGPAHAQTSIDGFGALPMNQLSSFGDSSFPMDFGGRVGFEITPGIQVLGEFGRIGNVLPEFVALPLSLAPLDLRVSAFYGEGGVRFLAAPGSAISPYVEGTAGVAHLSFGLNGIGFAGAAIARSALNLVDQRDPIVGAGGGVLLHGGPLQFDLGYRYKRVLTDSAWSSVLSAGQEMQSHQVRFGVGVRF